MSVIPNPGQSEENKLPTTSTGNASNPPLKDEAFEPAKNNQLIDERGEKYLREVASMEDYPDAQQEQEIDRAIEENHNDQ